MNISPWITTNFHGKIVNSVEPRKYWKLGENLEWYTMKIHGDIFKIIRKRHVKFQWGIATHYKEMLGFLKKINFGDTGLNTQTAIVTFLNNFLSVQHFHWKCISTKLSRIHHVKFQLNIFNQQEEILVILQANLILKLTVLLYFEEKNMYFTFFNNFA